MSSYEGRGRGGYWRGRGGYRGNYGSRSDGGFAGKTYQPRWQQREEPQTRPPSPPLGPLLATFKQEDFVPYARSDKHLAKIENCEYVASYNWLDKKKPTILVPGKPPAWTPLQTAVKLKEDSGTYYRDQNASRYPKYPTEPAVRALFIEHADFKTSSVDVFACGSTMGNLLRFICKSEKPFRFLVEVIGNTVFFIRTERSPTEVIPDVRGYGHTFPEAYTTWEADVKGSESHQRLVKYTFAGLNFLVRKESDGYLREGKRSSNSRRWSRPEEPDAGSLAAAFGATALGKRSSSSDGLVIEKGGNRIPQDTVFELKTRSYKKKDIDIVSEEIGRLWVGQVPNFVVAYHQWGVFDDIRTYSVRDRMKAWESENEKVLRQYAALIRRIIAFAKSRGDGRLEIRWTGANLLEVREQAGDGSAALPPELRAQWIRKQETQTTGGSGHQKEADVHEDSAEDDDWAEDNDPEGADLHDDAPGRYSKWHIDTDEEGDSDEGEKDFTACSAEDCGYCGRCTY